NVGSDRGGRTRTERRASGSEKRQGIGRMAELASGPAQRRLGLTGPRGIAAAQRVGAVTNPKTPSVKGLLDQFPTPALKELAEQQVRFAPPAKRVEQLARAEKLLAEIDPDRTYPYQFVCFRITEFRSNAYADLLIRGDVLEHDLCVLIEALAKTTPAVP